MPSAFCEANYEHRTDRWRHLMSMAVHIFRGDKDAGVRAPTHSLAKGIALPKRAIAVVAWSDALAEE